MVIKERLIHIDTDYASFGIITPRYTTTITDAAPIAHWTIHKDITEVLRYYYYKKHARIHITYIERQVNETFAAYYPL
jgi:hypothetical protein